MHRTLQWSAREAAVAGRRAARAAHLLRQLSNLPFQPLNLPLLLLHAVGELQRQRQKTKGRREVDSWLLSVASGRMQL